MGRVADAYGVRGWVKVAPEGGTAAQDLAAAKEWWLGADAHKVGEARIHGATVIARLSGIASREEARALRGQTVSVRREALPEPDEGKYYLADLLGLEVLNEDGRSLGVVTRMYTNGPQDVIEVTGERTRLLPWVPAIVKQVDLSKRQIYVEWGADW